MKSTLHSLPQRRLLSNSQVASLPHSVLEVRRAEEQEKLSSETLENPVHGLSTPSKEPMCGQPTPEHSSIALPGTAGSLTQTAAQWPGQASFLPCWLPGDARGRSRQSEGVTCTHPQAN